jgi:hypothetical protein
MSMGHLRWEHFEESSPGYPQVRTLVLVGEMGGQQMSWVTFSSKTWNISWTGLTLFFLLPTHF